MRPPTLAALASLLAMAGVALAASETRDSTSVSRACQSARNKTMQQQRAVTDLEGRIEKARQQRSVCASAKACRKADRGIEALEKRKVGYEAELDRYRNGEAKACPPA